MTLIETEKNSTDLVKSGKATGQATPCFQGSHLRIWGRSEEVSLDGSRFRPETDLCPAEHLSPVSFCGLEILFVNELTTANFPSHTFQGRLDDETAPSVLPASLPPFQALWSTPPI